MGQFKIQTFKYYFLYNWVLDETDTNNSNSVVINSEKIQIMHTPNYGLKHKVNRGIKSLIKRVRSKKKDRKKRKRCDIKIYCKDARKNKISGDDI